MASISFCWLETSCLLVAALLVTQTHARVDMQAHVWILTTTSRADRLLVTADHRQQAKLAAAPAQQPWQSDSLDTYLDAATLAHIETEHLPRGDLRHLRRPWQLAPHGVLLVWCPLEKLPVEERLRGTKGLDPNIPDRADAKQGAVDRRVVGVVSSVLEIGACSVDGVEQVARDDARRIWRGDERGDVPEDLGSADGAGLGRLDAKAG